jgi:hypothetical protein
MEASDKQENTKSKRKNPMHIIGLSTDYWTFGNITLDMTKEIVYQLESLGVSQLNACTIEDSAICIANLWNKGILNAKERDSCEKRLAIQISKLIPRSEKPTPKMRW